MNKTTSLYLDLLRFVAALIVVFGHFTDPRFCTVFPSLQIYAVCAVSVFFVLSGFVISYVTDEKENDAITYAAARFGRLYSVLVPALVVSLLIELLVWKLDSGYLYLWTREYNPVGTAHSFIFARTAIKSLAPLTFTGEMHGLSGYPALDGPMWSIGYEATYYAMFGIAVFARGSRRFMLLAAMGLLAGLDILRLLPVWAMGAALYRLTRTERAWLRHKAVGLLCLVPVVLQCLLWPRVRAWDFRHHNRLLESIVHGHLFSSDAFLYYYWGTATSLSILAIVILERPAAALLSLVAKPVRWFAAHTFSVYLFHYPVLVLLYAALHYDRSSKPITALVLIADLTFCVVFSIFCEPTKRWWRSEAYRWLQARFSP
jgi:peptidoglycan/LPS O-acetylase OafA/YrhL